MLWPGVLPRIIHAPPHATSDPVICHRLRDKSAAAGVALSLVPQGTIVISRSRCAAPSTSAMTQSM